MKEGGTREDLMNGRMKGNDRTGSGEEKMFQQGLAGVQDAHHVARTKVGAWSPMRMTRRVKVGMEEDIGRE